MSPFSLKTTTRTIVACMTLHNFIRMNDTDDEEFMLFNENVQFDYNAKVDENILEDVIREEPNQESISQMKQVRDNIRNHMSYGRNQIKKVLGKWSK